MCDRVPGGEWARGEHRPGEVRLLGVRLREGEENWVAGCFGAGSSLSVGREKLGRPRAGRRAGRVHRRPEPPFGSREGVDVVEPLLGRAVFRRGWMNLRVSSWDTKLGCTRSTRRGSPSRMCLARGVST